MGWSGLKNGNLLRVAEDAGVEVFVTGDKAMTYQQNMDGRRMAVVALSAHNWPVIKHRLAEIAGAVDNAVPDRSKRLSVAHSADKLAVEGIDRMP